MSRGFWGGCNGRNAGLWWAARGYGGAGARRNAGDAGAWTEGVRGLRGLMAGVAARFGVGAGCAGIGAMAATDGSAGGGKVARCSMRAVRSWLSRRICSAMARPPGRKRQSQDRLKMAVSRAPTNSSSGCAGCGAAWLGGGDVVLMTLVIIITGFRAQAFFSGAWLNGAGCGAGATVGGNGLEEWGMGSECVPGACPCGPSGRRSGESRRKRCPPDRWGFRR